MRITVISLLFKKFGWEPGFYSKWTDERGSCVECGGEVQLGFISVTKKKVVMFTENVPEV